MQKRKWMGSLPKNGDKVAVKMIINEELRTLKGYATKDKINFAKASPGILRDVKEVEVIKGWTTKDDIINENGNDSKPSANEWKKLQNLDEVW